VDVADAPCLGIFKEGLLSIEALLAFRSSGGHRPINVAAAHALIIQVFVAAQLPVKAPLTVRLIRK
jgi:hypothetical protein